VIDRKPFGPVLRLFVILWILGLPRCVFPAEVEINCSPAKISAFQGEKVIMTVEVINNSPTSYRNDGNLSFSYHLYDAKEKLVSYDNRRFKIPKILRRKKTTTFQVPLFFDHKTGGDYVVEFDIVKEGEFWGSSKKWKTSKSTLRLKPLVSTEFKKKYLPRMCSTGHELLDNGQYLLRLTLKNSEVLKDNKIFGFSAGSDYPAVWVRDTATFISYAKKYYPMETLAGSLELFFHHQGDTGEIVDWVNAAGETGKNTVETDQESSLVLAAREIARDNPKWLGKVIKGKKIVERLDMALEWVWENRRDRKWDLITSGFTADWGDVENTYPDERALKLSDRSTPVFSIYTQAMYIRAINGFLEILKSMYPLKDTKRVRKWEGRLEVLKSKTKKHLYLSDRGYFIIHLVPSSDRYFKMEREMLAVGGNAEAMMAGLMDKAQIKRFLGVLEKRRKEYNLRTVSFTLLPPYPEGFFPHHLLARPWNYQNGGEWDWIGGRVVKALFMNGFKKEAEAYLLEIVKKNLSNFCIFEWEDRGGVGRGAYFYSGAAGVIGDAIEKGYCR